MGETPSSFQAFLAELRRRRVFRVMALYGPAAFVVLQLADVVFPAVGLTESALGVLLVVGLAGFPIAVVATWLFETTPTGLKWTAPSTPEELTELTSHRGAAWLSIGFAAAGVLVLFGSGWLVGREMGAEKGGVASVILPVLDHRIPTVAVLPSEVPAGDADARNFAAGLNEEVRSQLSRRADLRVIARASVVGYGDVGSGRPEIGADLGADRVLVSTLRRDGARLRLIAELVEVSTGEQLWSHQYDVPVPADGLVAIQSETAARIVGDLRMGSDGPDEPEEEGHSPSDLAVYWFNSALAAGDDDAAAVEALRRAVEIDPAYVAAWSELARLLSWKARSDELPEDAEAALDAVLRVEAIAPASLEAFVARGLYEQYVGGDSDAALAALDRALRLAPSSAHAALARGLVLRRRGDWAGSTQALRYAAHLNPRHPITLDAVRDNLSFTGAFEAADSVNRRLLQVDPNRTSARAYAALLAMMRTGDVAAASSRAADLGLEPDRRVEGAVLLNLAMFDRDYARALELLDAGARDWMDLGHYVDGAGDLLSRCRILAWMGDSAAARVAGDSLVRILGDIDPDRADLPLARAIAYVAAGEADRARSDLRTADRLLSSWTGDHLTSIIFSYELADYYGRIGDLDAGFAVIEGLVTRPGLFQATAWLRRHPAYDPYRGDPRFNAIVARRARFEAEAAN